jgi:quinol-cytochrome oxidoreductase complex cytochrome b subunit
MPDYLETVVMLTAPFIVIGILFAVPFISNTGEKSPRRRPVAVLRRAPYIYNTRCIQLSWYLCSMVAKDGSMDQRGYTH